MANTLDNREVSIHATAAEQALLGACLNNAELIKDLEWLSSYAFYDRRHIVLWDAIKFLNKKYVVDWVLLLAHLKNTNKLNDIGGEGYLADIAGIAVSGINVPSYAAQIAKTYQFRQLRKAFQEGIYKLTTEYYQQSSPQIVADELEKSLKQILSDQSNYDIVASINLRDASTEYFNFLTAAIDDKDNSKLEGLHTGFTQLDKLTHGLKAGEFCVIGGRPGSGKSALMLSMASQIHKAGGSIGFISLEMSIRQLVIRAIARGGIPMDKLQTALGWSDEDIRKLAKAISGDGDNFYITDYPTMTITDIKNRVRSMSSELKKECKKLDVLFIDYLQLVTSPEKENRTVEVANISRELKSLARELEIPIIAGSQLTRASKDRPNATPQISDLKESGGIEQDADYVILLHEDKINDPHHAAIHGYPTSVILGKNRNGATGTIPFLFRKQFSFFIERPNNAPNKEEF